MRTIDWDSLDGGVFDFGGVMTVSPMGARWERTLYPFCAELGLGREALMDGFRRFRILWDGDDVTFGEFYSLVFRSAGLPPPTAEQVARLREFDAGGWVAEPRADTLELMRTFKAHGKKVGILSNMSSDFHRDFFAPNMGDYRALADVEVISGFERCCKPGRRIYDIARERMGCAAGRLVFFDDTVGNVLAARVYGWQSELFT